MPRRTEALQLLFFLFSSVLACSPFLSPSLTSSDAFLGFPPKLDNGGGGEKLLI